MNVFCHPGVAGKSTISLQVASLLGVDRSARPRFGIRPGVLLKSGRFDRTEIDVQIGDLFIEAKLTESGFQRARLNTIEAYADLETVFDVSRLPWTSAGVVNGYQLIRNVLAAYSKNASFCVILDARRRDLVETWYSVMSAVKLSSFGWRLKLLTWQELSEALPHDLHTFLAFKYGLRSHEK